VLSQADREAFASTVALLPISPRRLIARHLRALAAAPRAYLGTLALAGRIGRGLRGRIWQLFYFAEAVVLLAECRDRRIAHLHAHFTRPAADVALLASHLDRSARPCDGLTWSFSAHGADIYDTDPVALAEKIRRAAWVVAVSEDGRRTLETLVEPVHRDKIRVVHCGIDTAAFPALAGGRGSSERLRVLSVGRLVEVKGQAVLIDAFARLVADGCDAELTIVGEGPLREDLERLARDRGVADRVRFAGRVGQDDILSFYERADVFALTSFAEGVPVVLMEAMATELPVVASAVNGVPELVEDGVHGRLVPPGRSDLFAAALAALARDPEGRADMGAAGRERVAREFADDASAARLRDLMAEHGVQAHGLAAPVAAPRAFDRARS
jgi:glycosyltransferase involved in cell wall biosynthesis